MVKEVESGDGKSKLIKTERTVDDIKGESRSRPLSEEGRRQFDIIFRKDKKEEDDGNVGNS